jgi:hypothetical protein
MTVQEYIQAEIEKSSRITVEIGSKNLNTMEDWVRYYQEFYESDEFKAMVKWSEDRQRAAYERLKAFYR